jgi:NAD(P)-dependent dehydrogenase (short-subunit alcohol dehydrogenase family)
MADLLARQIDGITALVTGANRGLGKEFTQALLDAGAAKVYAGARDPSTIEVTDTRVVPVRLDITSPGDIAAAARDCTDVSLVINNAGAMLQTPFLSAPDMSAARTEMETNYFGALVNMLSVASWLASPFNASYCASKSAEWALTNALRVELHHQGTLVVGVHAGWIDTDMAATVEDSKISPREVAAQTLDAVEKGLSEVLTDDWTRQVKDAVATDQVSLYPDIQRRWDAGESPWKG